MKKLLRFLSFVVTWVFSFVIVYLQHIAVVDGGREADMFGLLVFIALVLGFIRWIENKIKLWEIHKEHKIFILNWRAGKRILLIGILTWVLFTIEDDLPKMQVTALLITFCFIIGWVLNFLGNLPSKIKRDS